MRFICRSKLNISLGVLLSALALSGCQQQPSAGAAGDALAKTAPEERFDHIIEIFRRGMETGPAGLPAGGVSRQEGSYTSVAINNEVSHKLFPPAKEGDSYRATVTILSRTRYSMQRLPADAEKDAKRDDANTKDDASGGNATDAGVEILDSDLISAPGGAGRRSTPAPGEAGFLRRTDEETRKYELVYKDDRWTLITEIDETKEPAVAGAFKRALSSQ
jgi:hypothetical protein